MFCVSFLNHLLKSAQDLVYTGFNASLLMTNAVLLCTNLFRDCFLHKFSLKTKGEREAIKKQFYLGQLTHTCEPTHPPPTKKERFGSRKVIFTVNLPEIFAKKGSNMPLTVLYKSSGPPDPTHPHLGQLYTFYTFP